MDERDAAARRKVTDRASGHQPSGFSGGHRSPQVRSNPAVRQEIDPPAGGPAATGLLASASMNWATTRALRTTDARRVDRLLKQLGALWETPALADITVVLNPASAGPWGGWSAAPGASRSASGPSSAQKGSGGS